MGNPHFKHIVFSILVLKDEGLSVVTPDKINRRFYLL